MDKRENNLRIIVIVLMTISIFLGAAKVVYDKNHSKESNDGEKFSLEYNKIPSTNMFKYRTLKEANNLIENGSGYFFLCNKDIVNCQNYALYLYEEAQDLALNTIYYVDIKEDKEKNTDDYKKLNELLKDKIEKIDFPLSVAVNKKEIVGVNSVTDENYWTADNLEQFKIEIMGYMNKISSNMCNDDCE